MADEKTNIGNENTKRKLPKELSFMLVLLSAAVILLAVKLFIGL